jgi:hypothetical protein
MFEGLLPKVQWLVLGYKEQRHVDTHKNGKSPYCCIGKPKAFLENTAGSATIMYLSNFGD